MSAQHTGPGARDDDFDALTDLFLGPDTAPDAAPAPLPAPELKLTHGATGGREEPEEEALVTEGLVLGHLPVRANPWVSQYARSVAEREGERVALVRLGGGQAGIDLYGLDPSFRECQAEETIDAALARVSSSCSRVIFQVQDVDELSLASSGAIDRVTILTAANDAAVVNVYRTIKSLSAETGEMGLAVMGAEDEKARRVFEKLREASRAFLNVDLVERGVIGKMGPTGGAMVYLGECETGLETIAARLRERHEEADGAVSLFNTRTPASVPAPTAQPTQNTAVGEGEHARVDRPQETVVRADVTADPGALALRVLELKPIGASCPDDEGVTLARDGEGALHLVCEDGTRRGVERLLAVSAWAEKHALLLGSVDGGLVAGRGVVRHLLTSEPKDVRHLLETDVRVHLMRRADERLGTGWVCVELN